MNPHMKLVGFGTLNKVKNHCYKPLASNKTAVFFFEFGWFLEVPYPWTSKTDFLTQPHNPLEASLFMSCKNMDLIVLSDSTS